MNVHQPLKSKSILATAWLVAAIVDKMTSKQNVAIVNLIQSALSRKDNEANPGKYYLSYPLFKSNTMSTGFSIFREIKTFLCDPSSFATSILSPS